MIEHECLVCGALMTDGWDVCVDCLADTFGRTTDPMRDHHNRELRERFQLNAEQEELLRDIMHGFRDGTRRYRPVDTEDDGEE